MRVIPPKAILLRCNGLGKGCAEQVLFPHARSKLQWGMLREEGFPCRMSTSKNCNVACLRSQDLYLFSTAHVEFQFRKRS